VTNGLEGLEQIQDFMNRKISRRKLSWLLNYRWC